MRRYTIRVRILSDGKVVDAYTIRSLTAWGHRRNIEYLLATTWYTGGRTTLSPRAEIIALDKSPLQKIYPHLESPD